MASLRWPLICSKWLLGLFLTGGFAFAAAEKKSDFEISQGDVRVILLRTVNSVSTNNEPVFEVTYAIEIPKKGAFSDLRFGKSEEITLSSKGVPIKDAHSLSSLSTSFETLPRSSELPRPVAQPEKAILGQHVQFTGLKIKEKQIDITVRLNSRPANGIPVQICPSWKAGEIVPSSTIRFSDPCRLLSFFS
jgi:hypothetical protein